MQKSSHRRSRFLPFSWFVVILAIFSNGGDDSTANPPDGTLIAFNSDQNGDVEICTVNADADDITPHWRQS